MYEYQYGKSRTAVVLAQLVSEHEEPKKIERKIGRLLMELSDVLAPIDAMPDTRCAMFLYELTFEHFSGRAKVLLGEGKLATFTINVMSIRKKQGLEKLRARIRAVK